MSKLAKSGFVTIAVSVLQWTWGMFDVWSRLEFIVSKLDRLSHVAGSMTALRFAVSYLPLLIGAVGVALIWADRLWVGQRSLVALLMPSSQVAVWDRNGTELQSNFLLRFENTSDQTITVRRAYASISLQRWFGLRQPLPLERRHFGVTAKGGQSIDATRGLACTPGISSPYWFLLRDGLPKRSLDDRYRLDIVIEVLGQPDQVIHCKLEWPDRNKFAAVEPS